MGGVFMFKLLRRILFCLLLLWLGGLAVQHHQLGDNVIRIHVVAASDSREDQAVKLQVRDAVNGYLRQAMTGISDAQAAKTWLESALPQLEEVANQALRQAGSMDTVQVKLTAEEFATRIYDTFSLPAGVYDALRITIGPGEGQNWWCVAFPSLCLPATSEGFQAQAVSAGFSQSLADTLTCQDGYELRFFLLDCLGQLENFLHRQ